LAALDALSVAAARSLRATLLVPLLSSFPVAAPFGTISPPLDDCGTLFAPLLPYLTIAVPLATLIGTLVTPALGSGLAPLPP
jgi:hypothetical protein